MMISLVNSPLPFQQMKDRTPSSSSLNAEMITVDSVVLSGEYKMLFQLFLSILK